MAAIASGVIGYERESRRHPAGVRTHILVCVGAAIVALIENMMAEQMMLNPPAAGVTMTLGRMSAQVISGIGFLGAGTIITTKRSTIGLTTAASVWSVGCIGIAAGMGYYGLCAIGAGVTLVVLTVIKQLVVGHVYKIVEVSFANRKETLTNINDYLASQQIRIQNIDFQVIESPKGNVYTNIYTLDMPRKLDSSSVVNDIAEFETVQKVRMRDP